MSTHEQRIRFRQLVRRQHGGVSLEQAAAVGLSRQAVARRVAARAWFPAGPRVYQVAEHEATPRSRAVGALLSLGPEATLVGTSAAWWWRLWDTAPARPQVAVPPDRRPRPRDEVDVARRRIEPDDRTRVDGLSVTTRSLSVLDAAADLGVDDGARLADRALLREAVTLERLRTAHRRYSGRRGAPVGAELIALAEGGARSWAERELHRRLRAASLGGWTANTEVVLPGYGRAVGDVVFAAEKVIVEVDGWAYHRDLRAFLRDGPRQSALAAAGWVVLRTHWYELRERPDAFLARLVATLRAR
ncbi:type IV toxin-antitoxin system AbiEi family antitoxin domain-containing protein [Actinomycetospora chlora]|uniref:Type IV toxin-antitoxin system AbiEi family antitoxin domain-containing protein n=1 Tax=Actinomycetospora chlora TaxID=663608 RepID=A0ABP9BCY4_9PSEU